MEKVKIAFKNGEEIFSCNSDCMEFRFAHIPYWVLSLLMTKSVRMSIASRFHVITRPLPLHQNPFPPLQPQTTCTKP